MMRYFRGMATNKLTQDFYGNKACARVDFHGNPFYPWVIRTVKRDGTCPIGYKKFYPLIKLHTHGGNDWATFFKEPFFFPAVSNETRWSAIEINDDPSLGLDLRIRSLSPIGLRVLPAEAGPQARALWEKLGKKTYVKFIYAHAFDNLPSTIGTPIAAGELIQLCDSTGASSGNHVHEGFKFCNDVGSTLDRDNGWRGNVPIPKEWDFTDTFVLDAMHKKHKLTNAQKVYKVAYYFRMPILNEVGKLIDN